MKKGTKIVKRKRHPMNSNQNKEIDSDIPGSLELRKRVFWKEEERKRQKKKLSQEEIIL